VVPAVFDSPCRVRKTSSGDENRTREGRSNTDATRSEPFPQDATAGRLFLGDFELVDQAVPHSAEDGKPFGAGARGARPDRVQGGIRPISPTTSLDDRSGDGGGGQDEVPGLVSRRGVERA